MAYLADTARRCVGTVMVVDRDGGATAITVGYTTNGFDESTRAVVDNAAG